MWKLPFVDLITENVQGGQGANLAEDDPLEGCNHGYPGGKGCYLCDSGHPYRKKEGEA
jgi:hypothetical protein